MIILFLCKVVKSNLQINESIAIDMIILVIWKDGKRNGQGTVTYANGNKNDVK